MLELLQYTFIRHALIGGLIVSVIAPMIGTFLVIRRYSQIADTLAHVALVGIAGALILNINPFIGTITVTLISALGLEKLRKFYRQFEDALLALFLSGSLATATVLISLNDGFNADLLSFLFGSLTTVSLNDLYIMAFMGSVVIITLLVFYQKFFLISFSEEIAAAEGIKTKKYNYLLILISALTVAISIQIVGVLLISALMVIPPLTAFQWEKSFLTTLGIAVIISVLSTIIGLLLSFKFDLAGSGTIVLTTLFFFIIHLIFINRKKQT